MKPISGWAFGAQCPREMASEKCLQRNSFREITLEVTAVDAQNPGK